MRSPILIHKLIAVTSFLILSTVLFFLLYNTYELKNQHYAVEERTVLDQEYQRYISNDKLFPGGAKILDEYVYRNIGELERLYTTDKAQFDSLGRRVCDSAFAALRKANTMDSVLEVIKKKHHLERDLQYTLRALLLDIRFNSNQYINLYDFRKADGPSSRIGGTLEEVNNQNLITALTVSAPNNYSYRFGFSLNVDTPNRFITILRQMMPAFSLALFSILSVVIIYYITFRNWLRQKKLSEMKSDFINSITHEFHTPLAAIIVANRTLSRISPSDNVSPLTEVINRQAGRLKKLIAQTLDITTLNKVTVQKETHSLHALLDEILLDYRLKLTGTNVQLSLVKGAGKDEVMADQFWFTTILLNILDNAIKYNDQSYKEIQVSTHNDKKNIILRIADNGVGMNAETQRMVFEKFYRREPQVSVGLGLGLYYVKQAIDAHNWKISVESTPGAGSAFIITIPIL
ncbi:sensor histidine kinase [Chitinophaga cymbidii]|uniref:histidine kinase n=1 Tax=Chitinophaga cymbidii TaxID=1096750 RepID=A0A512RGY6_9BACT|nr:HAMP domain-containing sensor histidine kinase [Chitinophaga cymbidii]GEP94963.1 two-component sensor histidine kinase [Chitinophaga cymbidii]